MEGRRHVQLAEVRLGQDGDLMSHIGCRAAGIIHRAADGLDDSAVKIHVGVLSNLADDERVEFFHNDHPFRRPLRRHKKLMGRSVRRAEKLTDRLLRYKGK